MKDIETDPISVWSEAKHPLRLGGMHSRLPNQSGLIPKTLSLAGETGQKKDCVFVIGASRTEETQASSPAEGRLCKVPLGHGHDQYTWPLTY